MNRIFSKLIVAAMAAVLTFITANKALALCTSCTHSGKSFQQKCQAELAKAQYSGVNFAYMCAPINTESALNCVQAIVDNRRAFTLDMANGCSWVTECGVKAIDALFANYATGITGGFIKAAGGTHSIEKAICLAQVFNSNYRNLTEFNLGTLCK